jgi:hypothetical protein
MAVTAARKNDGRSPRDPSGAAPVDVWVCWLLTTCEVAAERAPSSMNFLVAACTKSDQILGDVITQSAPHLNVMDLKPLDAATRLATPAISLQHLAAELAISFRVKS